jgi:hypothetical protein
MRGAAATKSVDNSSIFLEGFSGSGTNIAKPKPSRRLHGQESGEEVCEKIEQEVREEVVEKVREEDGEESGIARDVESVRNDGPHEGRAEESDAKRE